CADGRAVPLHRAARQLLKAPMVERRPLLTLLTHLGLLVGVAIVAFPLYVTFVASTLTLEEILAVPMRLGLSPVVVRKTVLETLDEPQLL
ncbi:hypothetical protein KFY46_26580, partial [Salmonella enterica subsp. enterica serovar 1,4,[5],12:i:-]|nr:hypothetical protein [Salmonella enterica subsp. enterica serovar 1,4,[5],12:i:-]